MPNWTSRITLTPYIAAAGDDATQVPALLRAMAEGVQAHDADFATDLLDAIEDVQASDTPTADADYWLAELYDWADARRVWIA